MAVTKEELELILRVRDQMSPQLEKANAAMRKTASEAEKLKKAQEAFKSIGKAVTSFAATSVAALAGVSAGIVKLAADASGIPQIAASFSGLGGSIEKMRAATGDMVSDVTLMQSYNQAAQLISKTFAQQLPDAMGTLQKVAAATGQDMGFMIDSLIKGVGRLSPMILDNLGIQVSLADATAKASEMYGKQADSLSKNEQQAGMMAVVMQKLKENTAAMPEVLGTAASGLAQFKTQIANIKDQLGQALIPVLKEILPVASDVAKQLAAAFSSKEFQAGIAQVVQGIRDVIAFFTKLDPVVLKAGVTAIALAVTLPKLAAAFTVVKTAVLGLNAVLLANPIGIAIAAITLAVTGLVIAADAYKKKVEEVKAAAAEVEAASRVEAPNYEAYAKETQEAYKAAEAKTTLHHATVALVDADRLVAEGKMQSIGAWQAERGELELNTMALSENARVRQLLAEESKYGAAPEIPAIDIDFNMDPNMFAEAEAVLKNFTARAQEEAQNASAAIADAFKDTAFVDALAESAEMAEDIMADLQDALIGVTEAGLASQENIWSQSTGALGQIMSQHHQQMVDMQFNYQAQQMQSEQVYQAQRAILQAHGKTEEIAKLDAKHIESQSMAARDHSVQEQMQQRSLIQQKIQQLTAYREELINQQNKVRQALAIAMHERMTKLGVNIDTQIKILEAVDKGTAAKLRIEKETAEKSTEMANLAAKGQIMAALRVAEAYAARAGGTQPAIDEANAQLKALENDLANFKIELPPLDLAAYEQSAAEIGKGAERTAERATEPATRVLSDVVKQIDDGIKAAMSAIDNLVDFDLPAGVETGLANVGKFVKMAVSKVYDWLDEPVIEGGTAKVKDRLKAIKDSLAPLTEVLNLVNVDLSKVKVADLPDLAAWSAAVKRVFDAAFGLADSIRTQYGTAAKKGEDSALTKAVSVVSEITAVLGLVKIEADKMAGLVNMPFPDLAAWGARLFAIVQRAVEVLTAIKAEVPGLRIAAVAVEDTGKVLSVVGVNFENLNKVVDMPWPDLAAWGARLFAVIQRTVEVLQAAKDIPGLNDAVTLADEVKSVLSLVANDFESITTITEMRWPDLEVWGQRLFAVVQRLTEVLTTAARELPDLGVAESVVGQVKKVLELVGAKLDFSIPAKNDFKAEFQRWKTLLLYSAKELKLALDSLGDEWAKAEMRAAEVAGNVKKVLDILGKDLDVKPPQSLWQQKFSLWLKNALYAADEIRLKLNDLADEWFRTEMPATRAADNIAKLLAILDIGLDVKLPTGAGWHDAFDTWLSRVVWAADKIRAKINAMGTTWAENIALAAPVAENVAKVADLLGVDLEFSVPRNGATIYQRAQDFAEYVIEAARAINDALRNMVAPSRGAPDTTQERLEAKWNELKEASGVAESIGKLVDLMGVNLKFELPKADFAVKVREYAKFLIVAAEEMLVAVQGLANDPRWEGSLKELAEQAGQLREVIGIIDLAQMFENIQIRRPAPGQIEQVVEDLFADLELVTPKITEGLTKIMGLWDNTDGLDLSQSIEGTGKLAELFGNIEAMAGALGQSWEGLRAIGANTLQTVINKIKDSILNALPSIQLIQAKYGGVAEGLNTTLDHVEAMVATVRSIIEMLRSLPAAGDVPTENLNAILAKLANIGIGDIGKGLAGPLLPGGIGKGLAEPLPTGGIGGGVGAPAEGAGLAAILAQFATAIQGLGNRPVAVNVYLDGALVKSYIDEGIAEAMAV